MKGNGPSDQDVIVLDERRLLSRHCQGDAAAFAELMKGFRAIVFSYLVRSGLNRAACDDVFQEVFIKVHQSAHTYEADKPLKPWLFAIVVNTVRSHYRKERVRQLVLAAEVPERTSTEPRADQTVEAKETSAVLEAALQELAVEVREVILLSAIERLEQNDVAQILGIPVGTVKTHLHRGRAALAKALVRRGVVAEREVAR